MRSASAVAARRSRCRSKPQAPEPAAVLAVLSYLSWRIRPFTLYGCMPFCRESGEVTRRASLLPFRKRWIFRGRRGTVPPRKMIRPVRRLCAADRRKSAIRTLALAARSADRLYLCEHRRKGRPLFVPPNRSGLRTFESSDRNAGLPSAGRIERPGAEGPPGPPVPVGGPASIECHADFGWAGRRAIRRSLIPQGRCRHISWLR
jgi:hypothetical protein